MSCGTVHVGTNNVVEVSKDILVSSGWKCEWLVSGFSNNTPSPCGVLLFSWNAFHKHTMQHAKMQKSKGASLKCGWSACNHLLRGNFTSNLDLVQHVEISHMPRIPFVCPIEGCRHSDFTRASNLETHYAQVHVDKAGKSSTPAKVSASWRPALKHIPPPPSLPEDIPPGALLIHVRSKPPRRALERSESMLSIASSQSPSLSQKTRRMDPPNPKTSAPQTTTSPFIFRDLVRENPITYESLDENVFRLLVHKQVEPHLDVSRPPMNMKPVRMKPPPSFLYEQWLVNLPELLGPEPEEEEENTEKESGSNPKDHGPA